MSFTHGTPTAWRWHKCDCAICHAAHAEYQAARYRGELANPKVTHPHGSIEAWNQRCRCPKCRVAGSKHFQVRDQRLQAETRPGAINQGTRWTDEDDEIVFMAGLTDVEKAKALGRTWQAVKGRRARLKKRQTQGQGSTR